MKNTSKYTGWKYYIIMKLQPFKLENRPLENENNTS